MNRINSAVLTIPAVLFGVLLAGEGVGETGSTLKKQLIGTWRLVSNYTEREDGTKFDTFGPNPIGIIGLDADGRMFLQEMRFFPNSHQTTADRVPLRRTRLLCKEASATLVLTG